MNLQLLPTLLLSLLSGGDEAPAAGEAGGPGLALVASKVLCVPLEGRQVVDNGVVLVRDGKIEAVGEQEELEIPEGYEVRDVGDNWLAPGLVELHNHIGPISPFFPNDLNDTVYLTNPGLRASPTVHPGTELQRRGVAGGVTCALFIPGSGSNMGGAGVLMKLGPEAYERMEVRNPGSLKLAQAGNPERWTLRPQRSFMNWNTRSTFRRGLAYAKRWADFEAGQGPKPEKDIQWELFRALAKGEARVSTHTQIYQVVLMTVTMVRKGFGLDVFIDHGSFDGYKAGGIAAEAGVPAILGPRMIATTFPGFVDTDGKVQGMAAGYQERGHTMVGFNTDCVDNGSLNVTPPQEELQLQAAMSMRYGFKNPNLEDVRGLTIVPAVTCGLGDRVGSIEPGKDADILVLPGSPVDPRVGIEATYVDGRLIYDAARDGRRW